MTKQPRAARAFLAVSDAHSVSFSEWQKQHPQKCNLALAKQGERLRKYIRLLREVDLHKISREEMFAMFNSDVADTPSSTPA